ncbi:hypothetical protein NS365_04695 [Aureimonas ureilytica]|uniref:Uncharacterized protein n=1 Tax=Aureimonas ureilytica TaxID=401562 RepID=A0A175RU97_9HYPH|nr:MULTISPECIES: hypothetical protein [Aureimonas]KTR07355.1 hypothetical protein NS365_04695 [Aureimonas ureilytica]
MNREQRTLARAALGLPNPRRQSYRNLFVIAPREPEQEDWNDMVAAGLAVHRTGSADTGPATYALTRAGADRAIAPGERLNPTDFPPIGAH